MSKRVVPPLLKSILSLDIVLTNQICKLSEKFAVTKSIKRQAKALEYSCHGLIWLVIWLLFVWVWWLPPLFQMQVNFFIGLILDIIIIACIKASTRRRRPAGNKDDIVVLGPDKYSFPSGHVSRAFYIFYFFTYVYPIGIICVPPLLAWSTAVSYSRILLRRHHLLDVLAGVVVGLVEGILISYIWLSRSSAFYLISWITNERFEGVEFDV